VGDKPAQDDGEDGLAFFGAITASVSHELNNVLSIIDQIAGLLEDQLATVRTGQPLRPERLQDIHGRIQKQTQRGIEIIRSLNRFAHSVDVPCCEFELADTLRNLLALTDRLAQLRRVRLEATYPPQALRMTGNPFLVQQAVFVGLRTFLTAAEPQTVIEIALGRSGDQARIEICGPAAVGATAQAAGEPAAAGLQQELTARRPELDRLLEVLAGTLAMEADGGRLRLALMLPLVRS
jgi:signal transduction histidine kinase